MKKPLIISLLVIFCIFFSLFSLFAQNEQITITTYYPSPFGSYRQLTWGNFPNTRGVLAPDNNAGSAIELGGLSAAGQPGIPYIDFSNDMASDFDARIILQGDDRLVIDGVTVRSFDARISPGLIPALPAGRALIPGCIRYTFTATSGNQECPTGFNVAAGPFRPTDGSGNPVTDGVFLCCQSL